MAVASRTSSAVRPTEFPSKGLLSHFRLLRAGLVVSAGAAVLAMVGCQGCNHYGEDGKPSEEPTLATTDVQSFGGVGSTFVDPLITRWMKDYSTAHKVQINYRPIGSGAGVEEFKKGYTTFAATDAPLDDGQLQGMRQILQIPITAGPVCVIYNVPGLSAPLRLSGKTLAGIFAGEIVNWQDRSIVAENPGAKLPHLGIVLVHRSDGSGTTNIFTRYLSSVSPGFSKKTGYGLSVSWTGGMAANGNSSPLGIVKQNPGTIGYIELSYAKQAGLLVASIQNRAGEFVAPSPEGASLAVSAFIDALAKDVRTPVVDPPAAAKGAYPISGITYVLIPKDDSVLGIRQTFKDFIQYGITSGQDSSEELSYAKLPGPIQQQSQMILNQMTDNGKPLK